MFVPPPWAWVCTFQVSLRVALENFAVTVEPALILRSQLGEPAGRDLKGDDEQHGVRGVRNAAGGQTREIERNRGA